MQFLPCGDSDFGNLSCSCSQDKVVPNPTASATADDEAQQLISNGVLSKACDSQVIATPAQTPDIS